MRRISSKCEKATPELLAFLIPFAVPLYGVALAAGWAWRGLVFGVRSLFRSLCQVTPQSMSKHAGVLVGSRGSYVLSRNQFHEFVSLEWDSAGPPEVGNLLEIGRSMAGGVRRSIV